MLAVGMQLPLRLSHSSFHTPHALHCSCFVLLAVAPNVILLPHSSLLSDRLKHLPELGMICSCHSVTPGWETAFLWWPFSLTFRNHFHNNNGNFDVMSKETGQITSVFPMSLCHPQHVFSSQLLSSYLASLVSKVCLFISYVSLTWSKTYEVSCISDSRSMPNTK